MHREALLRFLKSTELLCELPEGDLPAIALQLESIDLAEDEVLFEEGERGDAAYLIESGEIAMVSDGVEVVRRTRGGCIGEFSLLDDEPRSATVIARSAARLLRWRREEFLTALGGDPDMARALVRMLTRKLRSDVERGVDLLMERERWRQDMSRAREIQAGMLPPEALNLAGITLAARCQPAADVGGDFYDFLPFDDGEAAITIGDVTGHGFYSGLFVAMAKSTLHTQARFERDPCAVMEALRSAMELSLHRRLLMTCAYLLIDPRADSIRYAIAGHPHPIHYEAASGRLDRLEVTDPILGALDVGERPFHLAHHAFAPGDLVVLFSDGITEMRSPSGEEFGTHRIRDVVKRHARDEPSALRDALLQAVDAHAAGGMQLDDLTLVVVRRDAAS